MNSLKMLWKFARTFWNRKHLTPLPTSKVFLFWLNVIMISQKLRFEILKRDWFRCQYCGKDWKDDLVMLEVDHIIPKSRWWTDDVNNLITCCRACNMWKGNRSLDKSDLWKDKVYDFEKSIKREWTKKWNAYWLWTISHDTYVLLSKYVDIVINDYRCPWYPLSLIDVYENVLWNKHREWNNEYFSMLMDEFKKWWDFCTSVLNNSMSVIEEFLNVMLFEFVIDDNRWSLKDKKCIDEWEWDYRLNYLLSRELVQYISEDKDSNKPKNSKQSWLYYFVLKYSIRKDLLPERFVWNE